MEAYELIQKQNLKDLNCEGLIYKHIKSGARVVIIKNDDNNKVFSIGFRTPSTGNTGVQHITEHSTLCGSRKYPAKDPFVELVKGSLNTFLNAMTYPDKTVYPVASCNMADYKNLMDVYLDAVFYPNIYSKEEIFKQEGWHYESDGNDVKLNGVVFNEMKGAYSSPDDVLQNGIFASLFPDSPYRFDSGGNPEEIPNLTYQQFLDFHKGHYHPANSYIYLYGDIDVEERLDYLDKEYLSAFDKNDFKNFTEIPLQTAFKNPEKNEYPYAVLQDDNGDNKSYLSYSWVIDTALNDELCIAMDVLDYVLIGAPGAVLKQALLDRGIATDISSSFETSLLQPVFTIIAKNADKSKENEFLNIIKEVLDNAASNGLDEDMIDAGINYLEFRYREADFGSYPKGLIYNLAMLDSWIYDDTKPFIHIDSGKTFEHLKNTDKQKHFKDIIKKWLLDNNFAASVTLVPDAALDERRRNKEEQRIKAYIDTLTDEQKKELEAQTISLKEYQDEEPSQEDLEKIPLLSIDDIDKEPIPIEYEKGNIEGITYITEDIFTNDIGYLTLAFDCKGIDDELLPYLGLLNITMGLMDTENYSYADYTSAVNTNTGGIFTDISIRRNVNDYSAVNIYFDIKAKALYDKLDYLGDLIPEMLFKTEFKDKKRLKEIIAKTVSQLEDAVLAAGHTTASSIALSQFSNSRYYAALTRGFYFFKFLQELNNNFDEKSDTAVEKLNELTKRVFTKNNLVINFTADSKGIRKCDKTLKNIIQLLPNTNYEAAKRKFKPNKIKMAFTSPSQVNYVARAGNFRSHGIEYTGAMRVLKTIFSYEYLWQNVRVKGGAYGCMSEFGRSGDTFFVSYRDPNIAETNEIFEKAPEYVKNFKVSNRDMTKYIIGTIGSLDSPLTPSSRGARAFDAYLKNVNTEILRRERNEVLSANEDVIRNLFSAVQTSLDDHHFCVVGNDDKINIEKNLFEEIKPLV